MEEGRERGGRRVRMGGKMEGGGNGRMKRRDGGTDRGMK